MNTARWLPFSFAFTWHRSMGSLYDKRDAANFEAYVLAVLAGEVAFWSAEMAMAVSTQSSAVRKSKIESGRKGRKGVGKDISRRTDYLCRLRWRSKTKVCIVLTE